MCSVYFEKACDRIERKVLWWAIQKKGIPEVLLKSVISQYEGVETRVKMDYE